MIRFQLVFALLLATLLGCSSTGSGFSLTPTGSFLTNQTREVLDASPRAAALPRELSRTVLPGHFLQPCDVVVVEPVRLDSDVRLPADASVMLQLAVGSVALHVSDPPLAVTITVPVGVPAPGAAAATVKFTVTDWPTTDGSALSPVIVVVVFAALTWCASVSFEPL